MCHRMRIAMKGAIIAIHNYIDQKNEEAIEEAEAEE
jgi:hypothetical protein